MRKPEALARHACHTTEKGRSSLALRASSKIDVRDVPLTPGPSPSRGEGRSSPVTKTDLDVNAGFGDSSADRQFLPVFAAHGVAAMKILRLCLKFATLASSVFNSSTTVTVLASG